MADKRDNLQLNPAFRADGWVLLIFLTLLAFGWLSVCGASHSFGGIDFLSFDTRPGKQLVWSCYSHVRRPLFRHARRLVLLGHDALVAGHAIYCA